MTQTSPIRIVLILVFTCLALMGCVEDDGGDGPGLVSVSITPNQLLPTETGMTDEFFSITIVTQGFSDPIDAEATRVYYVDGASEVDAVFAESSVSGDTIQLGRIMTNWFQGQPPGTYDIGVAVQTEPGDSGQATESAEEVGLAQVTIVDQ